MNGAHWQPWTSVAARRVVAAQVDTAGALLPALHALQATFGYIDRRAVQILAEELNLSRADVHGVISFYRDFRTEPPGACRVRICRGEACQASGGDRLADQTRTRLGIDFGETDEAGTVSLDEVFCLGNCALAPAVTVDGRLLGRVDAADLDALLPAR